MRGWRAPVTAVAAMLMLLSCGGSLYEPGPSPSVRTASVRCHSIAPSPTLETTLHPSSGRISRYPLPGSGPTGIAIDLQGTLWVSETGSDQLGRLSPAGVFSQWELGGAPGFLTIGGDGSVWVPEETLGAVARVTSDGHIDECLLPLSTSNPYGVAASPDGSLWIAEKDAGRIGRLTSGGTITEYSVPGGGDPVSVAIGPDGNVWFSEGGGGAVGRMTPAGVFTMFNFPGAGYLGTITVGPDGAMWFTEFSSGVVGRITTAGEINEFRIPDGGTSKPNGIAPGPDRALWFAESGAGVIGRITTSGQISERLTTGGFPDQLAFARDGSLWITDFAASALIRVASA